MARFTKILKNKAMKKLATDKKIHELAYRRSKKKFDLYKKRLLTQFTSHPITKEIEAGPDASNSSETIAGSGNLFSFIGFNYSDRPIAPIWSLLNSGVSLLKSKPNIRKTKNRVYISYRINIPTEEQFTSVSKMPWETGSWLYRIERGISGIGHYMFENYIRASRSRTGIQVDGKMRQGMYKRTSYISAILNTFRKGVSK
ncbi:hypothetical protein CL634_11435 [bacterium]|nr:hypothetical protein [bacterium]|tara:strand:+ start:180 stop:779 length:600 start_codon:yes stop_codon:yes gene_type:complete